jgi:hypothetical protein
MKRTLSVIAVVPVVLSVFWLARAHESPEWQQPASDIVFDHALHVDDAGLECTACHGEALTSTDAADRLFPTMDICADCHDIDDDEMCGQCHRNPDEPEASPHPARSILFSHRQHVEQDVECAVCHGTIAQSTETGAGHLPRMSRCFECHDGIRAADRCDACHGEQVTLDDIHPVNWRHSHAERAALEPEWCAGCHRDRRQCVDCHRGDNLTGYIHDLNYVFTHGLDAASKAYDCASCHDRRTFCNACHEGQNRIPLLHSTLGWLTEHGEAARRDVENCASCHDASDPTCARGGCHGDFDGVRGTDNPIHPANLRFFDTEGIWHESPGYYCYQCHVNTGQEGTGFCGYCHD